MKLYQKTIDNLARFLDDCQETVYREPHSEMVDAIRADMWGRFKEKTGLKPPANILDIGFGNCEAMALFLKDGYTPYGITANRDEFAEAPWVATEHRIRLCDMHDIGVAFRVPAVPFHAVWCRHVLEHSPIPAFALQQIYKRLEPEGVLYVEVPSPDTPCCHVQNPNHYSVLGRQAWYVLIQRAGFEVLEEMDIQLDTQAGPDVYFAFICRKKNPEKGVDNNPALT